MEQTIEMKLKSLILSKHKSLLSFTKIIDLPYSTLDSVFKRGVNNASITTIIKICQSLGISADKLAQGEIVYNDSLPQSKTNNLIITDEHGQRLHYELTSEQLKAILIILDNIKNKG